METLCPGQILPDGIEIIGEYFQGGMGSLFRARDTTIQADCLIKIAKVIGCDEDEKKLRWRRLEREARALIQIQHPNVVVLKTIGHLDGMPYLVFPFYTGKWITLSQILESNTLPSGNAIIEIFKEILAGVRAIHETGFVHQDLKPSNILVCEEQPRRAVIIDLGIAKSVLDDPESRDTAGCSPGTPSYMAPEIIHGDLSDHRADIFAIGCMMYRCMVGVAAYPASTRLEASQLFERGEPHIPEDLRTIHGSLAQICEEAIRLDPSKRIGSISLFASRLNASELQSLPAIKHVATNEDTGFGNIADEIESASKGESKKPLQHPQHNHQEPHTDIKKSRSLSLVQKALVGSVVVIGVLSAIHDGSTQKPKDDRSILSLGEGQSKPLEAKTMGLSLEEFLLENKASNHEDPNAPFDEKVGQDDTLEPRIKNKATYPIQQKASHRSHINPQPSSKPYHPKPSFVPSHWASLDTSSYRSNRIDDTHHKTDDKTWLKKISPSKTYRGTLLNKLSSHSAGTRAVIELVEPIRAGHFTVPTKSRVTGLVSHHLVGKQGCRAHVAVESLTLPNGETIQISGSATVAGVAGLPCKILGNVERRKERAISNGLIDIASQTLSGIVPQIAPVGDRLADASQEDVQQLTEKDPEAVVSAHLNVDLQLDGGT